MWLAVALCGVVCVQDTLFRGASVSVKAWEDAVDLTRQVRITEGVALGSEGFAACATSGCLTWPFVLVLVLW